MNDRFKFIAGVSIPYFDKEDNEKELIFEIKPDGIFQDDEIGILRDTVMDIIKTYDLSDNEWRSITDYLDDHEQSDNWLVLYPDYIRQCTGIKDKNGNLIYEGDIVEVSEAYENGIYKIEFCQSDCEYNLYNKEGNFIYQLTRSMARYMKVIGNIYENKELLDEQ